MIQPQELRLGNLVLYRDEISIVKGVLQTSVDLLVSPCVRFTKIALLPNIYPIPLTEEWLVRLGFDKKDGHIQRGKIMALPVEFRRFSNGPYSELGGNNGIYIGSRIKYVHEYQNMFFALTGQELLINPKSV